MKASATVCTVAHPARRSKGPDRSDDRAGCAWGASAPEYLGYHDDEWGRPLRGDDAMYERLVLEAFQSGLSWLTILRKRDGFRRAFAGFRVEAVARFGAGDVERLMGDASIVRHRGKIVSTINNAKRAQELRAEYGSLAAYFWRFEPAAAGRVHVAHRASRGRSHVSNLLARRTRAASTSTWTEGKTQQSVGVALALILLDPLRPETPLARKPLGLLRNRVVDRLTPVGRIR